ncbi:O-antigen ligase family protein [Patescibacteria group bacterium]|nr:O-antigen ligase family protein [Patescibacteria group bacterium]MBU4482303.1 O-antigen ligase family protein [Patescibacteria group bacterium]
MKNKLNKTIEYLLYLFVFLIPWQTRWIIWDTKINGQVWEYGRICLYAFDVVFVILLILFLISNIKYQVFRRKNILLATCYLLLVILNFIISDDKLLSFYWLLRILQGILLIWLISKINFSKIKLVMSFVISMALSAGLGIYQFLTQSAFASKWLGLASHSASALGDSVVELANERWLRAYGSFPHPNILAGFIIIAIILCLWLLNKNTRINYLLLSVSCYLLIVGLFFTFSRAGWIAFGIIILLVCYLAVRDKIKLYDTCYMILATCLLVFSLSIIYFPLVQTRIQGSARLEVASNTERINNLEQSFEIIKNNLWLGTGVGNYTVELQKTYPNQPAYFYQPVHNVYLLVLAELGIVGVLLIVIFLFYFIKSYSIKFTDYWLLIIGYFFFFDHFWWTLPSGVILVFLLVFSALDKGAPEM